MIVSGFCKEVFRELPMEFAVEAQKLLSVSLEGVGRVTRCRAHRRARASQARRSGHAMEEQAMLESRICKSREDKEILKGIDLT